MLNPSTATASTDDATIRRVTGFSRHWGFGSAVIVNLFALRATTPSLLGKHRDPVGPDNDSCILRAVDSADVIVVAWGNHGSRLNPTTRAQRDSEVHHLLPRSELYCLGLTARGQPRHPLYLPTSTEPVAYPEPLNVI
jgi:hypothetical protein